MALGRCTWHNLLLKYKTDCSRHSVRACVGRGVRDGGGRPGASVGPGAPAQLLWDKREAGLWRSHRLQGPDSRQLRRHSTLVMGKSCGFSGPPLSHLGNGSDVAIDNNNSCHGLQGAFGRMSA